MSDKQDQSQYSQTLVMDEDEFVYNAIEQHNGKAITIKFKVDNPEVKPGDTLVVLSETDVQFHGLISTIEDGYATASDQRGSMLPAGVH